jgi:hypothetical protein
MKQELRPINVNASIDKSILKSSEKKASGQKSVMFSDGVMPGETSSSTDDEDYPSEHAKRLKMKNRKRRKLKVTQRMKENKKQESFSLPEPLSIDPELENAAPPLAPAGNPPPNLEQPRLISFSQEWLKRFPVNLTPLFFFPPKHFMGPAMGVPYRPPQFVPMMNRPVAMPYNVFPPRFGPPMGYPSEPPREPFRSAINRNFQVPSPREPRRYPGPGPGTSKGPPTPEMGE